ncbi:MAG: hypothetical protein JWL73_759 [Actinomycetia bacterium]|nr:hypothetical protein [Actinomycetes bacterium]
MTQTATARPAAVAPDLRAATGTSDEGLTRVFIAVFGLAGWIFGLQKLSDNSYLWHVRTGQVILDSGVPHHDVFSFSIRGHAWIAQSWLAELAYGVVNRYFGGHGLQVLSAATGALVAMLLVWIALELTHDRVRAVGVAALAAAPILLLWSERPLALGLLALALVVVVVELPSSRLGLHPLIVLPVVFWVWGNVHGTWLLGMVYVGLHALARWIDGHPWYVRSRERTLVVAVLLSAVLLLANPYGVGLITFPVVLFSRGDVLQHVVEWQSPNFRDLASAVYALWLVAFIAIGTRAWRRYGRRDLIVGVPFLLLAFWAQRNIALAVIVTLPIVARACAPSRIVTATEERAETGGSLKAPARTSSVGRVALVAVVALGGLWLASTLQHPAYDLSQYPVKTLARLDHAGELGPRTRLLTTDAWAGYVIAKYWPHQPVFFDDRYDTYPVAQTRDYTKLLQGDPGWKAILDGNRIGLVVWPKDLPLTQILAESPDWRRQPGDKLSAVFQRRPSLLTP